MIEIRKGDEFVVKRPNGDQLLTALSSDGYYITCKEGRGTANRTEEYLSATLIKLTRKGQRTKEGTGSVIFIEGTGKPLIGLKPSGLGKVRAHV